MSQQLEASSRLTKVAFAVVAAFLLFNSSLLCVSVEGLSGQQSGGGQNNTKIRQSIREVDACLLKSVYSFIYQHVSPPTTSEQLRNSCRTQSEGFKCVKERSRSAPPLVRRGLLTFVGTRQRYHKKYCTNVNSEHSQRFINDIKCIMEKRADVYKQLDSDLANTLIEIAKKNYDDSKIELNYLCCALINYRKGVIDNVNPGCASSKAQVEEMIMSIVPNDINLICDDEEKLSTKVCPTLEPLRIAKNFTMETGNSPSALTLYLVATLGEPE